MAAPCSWDLSGQTGCCSDFWATLTPEEQAAATAAATKVLWAATGRRYGLCPVTVRPCGRNQCDENIGGWFWDQGIIMPYVLDGLWFNCPCFGPCECGARCRVYLPGPVGSITSVTLDGALVDPSTYRVDDGRWLVRVGEGLCWPDHQNYDRNSGTDTFFVTYTQGEPIPADILAAAGTYACEWAKSCLGLDCQLPSRVVTLNRQGTTFQMVDIDALLERGLTGIASVDQVIAADNPYGTTHRMRLLSPEWPQVVQTTWP
jgi:hypothetical protein